MHNDREGITSVVCTEKNANVEHADCMHALQLNSMYVIVAGLWLLVFGNRELPWCPYCLIHLQACVPTHQDVLPDK